MGRDQLIAAALSNKEGHERREMTSMSQLIAVALSNEEGHERIEMTSNIKGLKRGHELWKTTASQAIKARQTSPPSPALLTPTVIRGLSTAV